LTVRLRSFWAADEVESETDHLPIEPEERKLWDSKALVEKEKEIADATQWARDMVLAACEAVIRRFGGTGN
jgi:hypothetical protein